VFVCLFEAEVFVNWRASSRLAFHSLLDLYSLNSSHLMTEILEFHANFVDFIGRSQERAAAVRGARDGRPNQRDLTPPGTDDLVRPKQKQDRPPRRGGSDRVSSDTAQPFTVTVGNPRPSRGRRELVAPADQGAEALRGDAVRRCPRVRAHLRLRARSMDNLCPGDLVPRHEDDERTRSTVANYGEGQLRTQKASVGNGTKS
jgi:hypothetical protein